MRGKKAKLLRKKTGFVPKADRDYGLITHKNARFAPVKDKEKMPRHQIVNQVGSARAQYQAAK